jgi:pyruvate,water dikinase
MLDAKQYVKRLNELRQSDLSIAGGKAANLGALIDAGLPVPKGFCITTNAYLDFVKANKIEDKIGQIFASANLDVEDISSLENTSRQIRNLFFSGQMPRDILEEIKSVYLAETNSSPVAVRSSATVEDLPDMSFAGQQDTFLNVIGADALIEAVVKCWASLWNARAIGYRARAGIASGSDDGGNHSADATSGVESSSAKSNSIALAVVVQKMVQSEVSGVMFTANPLTGKRTESVIDATIGLGEALVSGQVEPDHYLCDNLSFNVLEKTIGKKALSIRSLENGGTVTVTEEKNLADRQIVADDKISEIVKLGKQAVKYFQKPQDIEWAIVDGKIYLVQSRPITSLYPLPKNPLNSSCIASIDNAGDENPLVNSGRASIDSIGSPNNAKVSINSMESDVSCSEYEVAYEDKHPLKVWFSFGSWQGMLDPFTPMGRDMFATLANGIGQKLGLVEGVRINSKHSTSSKLLKQQNFFAEAAERLHVNLTPLFRKSFGRKLLPFLMAQVEPAALSPIKAMMDDPRLRPVDSEDKKQARGFKRYAAGLQRLRPAAPFLFRFVRNFIRNIISPDKGRKRIFKIADELVVNVQERADKTTSLSESLEIIKDNVENIPGFLFPNLVPAIAAGQAPLAAIRKLSAGLPGDRDYAMELTRGLPYNVTTEMDLELWRIATEIKNDAVSKKYFDQNEASTLAPEYLAGKLPTTAQELLDGFISSYGFRGIAEIDIGRLRWREKPDYVMQIIKNYLTIENTEASPEAVFKRGQEQAKIAADDLVAALKAYGKGATGSGHIKSYIKSHIAKFMIKRVRKMAGLREFPKFTIMRLFGIQREMLIRFGENMVGAGLLEEPNDVFFLHLSELEHIASKLEHTATARIMPNGAASSNSASDDSLVQSISVKDAALSPSLLFEFASDETFSHLPLSSLVAQRKQLREKEKRRKRIPRILLGDGEAFFEGMTTNLLDEELASIGDNTVIGSPVSAGIAEGIVRVVTDPFSANLKHGEIMVCPATDPAWTPLFLSAAGLVMEVGGMMTHGSVVAREYGIPAVVGVSQATTKLKTGQRVRVDGNSGVVYILK